MHLLALNFPAREGAGLDEVYAGGAFAEGLARRNPLSLFLAFDPSKRSLQLLAGEFCPLGRQLARVGDSLLFAPELKAFSNVKDLKGIETLPAGFSLRARVGGGRAELQTHRTEWPPPQATTSYEAAVGRCRELMERGLDGALAGAREVLGFSFSGGVDSSILAHMLVRRGVSFRAFNVWFESGATEAPEDLTYARRVASELGFPLEEIRVTPSRLRSYLAESVYYGERISAQNNDNALYYLPLLEAIREAGLRTRICADGCDTFFGGYEIYEKFMEPERFRGLYLSLVRDGTGTFVPNFHDFKGVRLLAPFTGKDLLDFALALPQEYLVGFENGRFVGKRVLRDAFRGDVPEYVLDRRKGIPGEVNEAREVTARLFGGSGRRDRAYKRLRERLLTPIDLRGVPAWAVRAGLLDWRRRPRLKRRE